MAAAPTRATRVALWGGLALALFGLGLTVPVAHAAPGPCTLTVDSPTANSDGSYSVSGTLKEEATNTAVSGAAMSVDGQSATATTDASGRYNLRLVGLSVGSHTVTIRAAASTVCVSTSKTTTVTVTGPDLGAVVDPTSIVAGEGVEVKGRLTFHGAGIAGAWIDISIGNMATGATTGDDGSYSAYGSDPAGNDVTSFFVTLSYSGEGRYPPASQQISVIVTAGPTIIGDPGGPTGEEPTTEWTPPTGAFKTPTPTPTASPTRTTSVSPVAPLFSPGSPAMIVVTVFAIVIFIAAGTLLVIAVVSRRRRGLAADERRGFGSDFGQAQRALATAEAPDTPEPVVPDSPVIDELPPEA